jgi:hypothetical protein
MVEGGPDDNLDWTTFEMGGRYQVFKEKDAWARLSLEEIYKVALQAGKPDVLEEKVLAAKDIGKFSHILNIMFDNEVGDDATGGVDANFSWKSKYRLLPWLEPGAEAYIDPGKLSGDKKEKYQVGPTISGKFGDSGIKYDFGYLFGLNEGVADGRVKVILTYAFKPFGEQHE